MRISVTLDDDLVEKAMAKTGINQRSLLVREALTALIQRAAARQVTSMGSDSEALAAPNQRDLDSA